MAFLPQRNELFRSITSLCCLTISQIFFHPQIVPVRSGVRSIIWNCCPAALLLHLFYIRIELFPEMSLLQDKPWQFLLLLNALFILLPQIWCFYWMLLMSKEDKLHRAKAFALEKGEVSNNKFRISSIFTFAFPWKKYGWPVQKSGDANRIK